MTPEGKVVAYLRKRVGELGGEWRKVSWEGRIGAPDALVFFPGGPQFFVELKAPGEKPRKSQLIEHERLRRGGFRVYVCDSPEEVERTLTEELEKHR